MADEQVPERAIRPVVPRENFRVRIRLVALAMQEEPNPRKLADLQAPPEQRGGCAVVPRSTERRYDLRDTRTGSDSTP